MVLPSGDQLASVPRRFPKRRADPPGKGRTQSGASSSDPTAGLTKSSYRFGETSKTLTFSRDEGNGATSPPATETWPIFQPPGSRSWKRSEEHTSELQSRLHLVCRLLLEKKNCSRATLRLSLRPFASPCTPAPA